MYLLYHNFMYWYCLELHSQLFLPALVLANVPVILIYLRIKIDFELLNKSRSGNFIFLIFFTVIFNFWIFYLLIQIKLLRKKTSAVDVIFSFDLIIISFKLFLEIPKL